jgi:solute carrier family 25, member 39/40
MSSPAGFTLEHQILASIAGSSIATICLNPVNVIKVHLQRIGSKKKNTGDGVLKSVREKANKDNSDIYRIARNVFRENGIRGFWAGAPVGLAQAVPSSILYMTNYEYFKRTFIDMSLNQQSLPLTANFSTNGNGDQQKPLLYYLAPGLAGGIARTISVIIISPMELLRTLQSSGVKRSIPVLAMDIYRQEGISGFYRGLNSTIMRDTPFSMLYWFSFERSRDVVKTSAYTAHYSLPVQTFMAGCASAMAAAVITHPFDVLKTHQQVKMVESSRMSKECKPLDIVETATVTATGGGGRTTTSLELEMVGPRVASVNCPPIRSTPTTVSSFKELYKRGGLAMLFKGLSMRMATVIPASAIMVTVYETVKSITGVVERR